MGAEWVEGSFQSPLLPMLGKDFSVPTSGFILGPLSTVLIFFFVSSHFRNVSRRNCFLRREKDVHVILVSMLPEPRPVREPREGSEQILTGGRRS